MTYFAHGGFSAAGNFNVIKRYFQEGEREWQKKEIITKSLVYRRAQAKLISKKPSERWL